MDKKEIAQKLLDHGKSLGYSKEDLRKGIRYAWHLLVTDGKPKAEKKPKAPKPAAKPAAKPATPKPVAAKPVAAKPAEKK